MSSRNQQKLYLILTSISIKQERNKKKNQKEVRENQ